MIQGPSPTPGVAKPVSGKSFLPAKFTGFFRSRWHGETPLMITFWRDMLCGGTAINIPAALLAIILHAANAPAAIALAIFFMLLPWNIFLFLAVWRSSELAEPSTALVTRSVAALWLGVVIVM